MADVTAPEDATHGTRRARPSSALPRAAALGLSAPPGGGDSGTRSQRTVTDLRALTVTRVPKFLIDL